MDNNKIINNNKTNDNNKIINNNNKKNSYNKVRSNYLTKQNEYEYNTLSIPHTKLVRSFSF